MKEIKQEAMIPAKPEEVYSAFMDEKKHADFTNAEAKIENRVGGKFSVWDGYASGKNLELIPGKKIVQTWRASDWPENAESKLTIELIVEGDQTKLKFKQINIPDEFAGDVEQGWADYYWQPMIEYFENKK